MKEKFEDRNLTGVIALTLKDPSTGMTTKWTADKAVLIENISKIVTEYARQGYRLTLRQLYYQLVTKNVIRNHDTIYKKLSSILDDCRYGGVIDWNAIEDRGRVPFLPYFVSGVDEALADTWEQYRIDRQIGQDTCIEVWTEKDAISGILRRVTSEYHVQLVVNKGYSSSSAMYEAYKRFANKIQDGKKIVILYLGDHDPSGLDMVRDICQRLMILFANGTDMQNSDVQDVIDKWWDESDYSDHDLAYNDDYGFDYDKYERLHNIGDMNKARDMYVAAQIRMWIMENKMFEVKHIGLTREQIKQYSPPPNPAKITDPRAAEYIKKNGNISYEVDALRPEVLVSIVRNSIEGIIDMDKYRDALGLEQQGVETIKSLIKGDSAADSE